VTPEGDLLLRAPGWLAVALLAPAALLLARRARVAFAPASLGPWPRSARAALAFVPPLLASLGVVALALALARPAASVTRPGSVAGIDVVLCLDTSSSMTERDLDPRRTRLEVVKDAAAAFVLARGSDRIGLVTFARYPDLVCPPTLDHAALLQLLRRVETVRSDGPEDATGIGAAVARSVEVLGADPGRSRVVVLLTDGDENVALEGLTGEIPPAHAAQLAERLGVRVDAIVAGVVRTGAGGAVVPLDTRTVEGLALRTGGTFHEARDAEALQRVYATIDRLAKAPVPRPERVLEDRHVPFLLAGLLLLLLARALAETVWRRLP
jgi:Ca-activated chloride channel family protein